MIQPGESDNRRRVEIGRAIRRIRKARNLSQSALGAVVGVSQNWISNIERGWPCSISLLTQILEHLDVPDAATVARSASESEHAEALLDLARAIPDAQIIERATSYEAERERAELAHAEDVLRRAQLPPTPELIGAFASRGLRGDRKPRLSDVRVVDGVTVVTDVEDGEVVVGPASATAAWRPPERRAEQLAVAAAQLEDVVEGFDALTPVMAIRPLVLNGVKALLHDARQLRQHFERGGADSPEVRLKELAVIEAVPALITALRFITRGAEELWPAYLLAQGEEITSPETITPPWISPVIALSRLRNPLPAWGSRDENPYTPAKVRDREAAKDTIQTASQWFEVSLAQCLEMAGASRFVSELVEHNDGEPQPDVVVKLPTGRTYAIDVKTPRPYDSRPEKYISDVKRHIDLMASAGYRNRVIERFAPDTWVLFMPGEHYLSGRASELIGYATDRGVTPATPRNLTAALRRAARVHDSSTMIF